MRRTLTAVSKRHTPKDGTLWASASCDLVRILSIVSDRPSHDKLWDGEKGIWLGKWALPKWTSPRPSAFG